MRYTKYIAIAALAAAALLAGCADDEQLGIPEVPEAMMEAQNTANAKPTLTPEQQLMKQNLDAAAQLLVAALNKPTVQRELQQLDYEKMRTDRLSFEQLLRNPAKDSRFRSLATELGRSLNAGAKGSNNLADYLIEQGCELYLPYPLDWYPADAPITVAGHPIDNVVEGLGHVWDAAAGTLRTVLVNDEYADKNPVAIVMQPQRIMPEPGAGRDPGNEELLPDPDWDDWGWYPPTPTPTPTPTLVPANDLPEDKAGKKYEVRIKELRYSHKTNIFEGDFEIRIGRVRAGQIVDMEEIVVPKAYVKAAYNGWSRNNGGWYDLKTPRIWDSKWGKEYEEQAFFAYEYDPENKIKEYKVSVKIKDYVTVEGEVKTSTTTVSETFSYEGDFIGHKVWDRTWFITKAVSESRNGWPVRAVGNLEFTIKGEWY